MEFLTDIDTFTDYIPEIVRLHQQNNNRFPTGMENIDVASELIRVFKSENITVLETYPLDKEIKFFASIELFKEDMSAFWWMIYSHPRNMDQTHNKREEIIDYLAKQGYNYIDSLTTRITPSYKRWMKKSNFFPYKIYYRRKLK